MTAVAQSFAAPAGKGECVEQDRTDLRVEFRAHERPGAVQPRLDRLGPYAEQARRLLDAQPLDHPRDEDGPVKVGNPVRRPFDQLQYLPLRHCPFRVVGARVERERDDIGLPARIVLPQPAAFARRVLRKRPSASLMTMRESHVARVESPRKPRDG